MGVELAGSHEMGIGYQVWYRACGDADAKRALDDLAGNIEPSSSVAGAMGLAWSFALAMEAVPAVERSFLRASGQPVFVYLDAGEGTGWQLDSGDLGPDANDGRVVALLVLEAPREGGMATLWERSGDGPRRIRRLRPTPGMVIAYAPGRILWEVEPVQAGSFVAVKVTLT